MVEVDKSQTNDSSSETNNPKPVSQKTEDINELKGVSAVAYLGILFFIPMVTHPESEFAMFHANQGLLLLIAGVIVGAVGGIIPFIGWFIIAPLGSIFILVLFIMGLVNALQGQMKRLPLIGKFDLIKVEGK